MNKMITCGLLAAVLCLTACGNTADTQTAESAADTSSVTEDTQTESSAESTETEAVQTEALAVASGDDVIAADTVGYEGMEPVYADALQDGRYPVNVDSSSSMFKIAGCELIVADGAMTAELTINSKSYEHLYAGTADQAAKAAAADFIEPQETGDGCVFTVPVEALDQEIDCAAFSAKKQLWYDRKLVFRADSLADEAFKESRSTSAEALSLADGEYTIDVKLEGGSGKASVQSPAKLTVSGGKATAEIIWGSNHYDYMIVADEKYLPVSTEEYSVFEIPVTGFDYPMPVSADTTAMSTPHEIAYTLYFDSSTIQ